MPADLLFEIGTEEIPAGYLVRALAALEQDAAKKLREARLSFGAVSVLGTPRRIALIVRDVADRQPDVSERVVGPPARVAFDGDGNPTKAAIGFAKRNKVDVASVSRSEVEGKKGEYAVCTRAEAGRAALEVLPPVLERLITALPFPKSMRWGTRLETFVRPVHWLVAVLGDQVVPIEFAGITASGESRGHRFLAPAPLAVTAADYVDVLRSAFVVVEPAARREMIAAEIARIETETGFRVRPDERLLEEVSFLVEYPVAVCGEFDEAFLEVPEEAVVSAMRSHQRYFSMEDASGALRNRFVTIAGTITRDVSVVRAGNERVLAARLSDARFFFRADRKSSLDQWSARLEDVVFQKKLGTIAAKATRIGAAASVLAKAVGAPGEPVSRAAALCKADLVSNMVDEFPELQGIMGRHYARLAGEPDAVCDAIAEHYLPRSAADALPTGDVGAVVGIADRLDTIVGCFAAKLVPTGSADPYGLRRAALAVLAILVDRGWSVGVSELIATAAAKLESAVEVTDAHRAEVAAFFTTRLRGMLVDGRGLPIDCVDAAIAAGCDDIPDTLRRAQAVAKLRTRSDFEPLATAFKRIANILKGTSPETEPDPDRFTEDSERALWNAFQEAKGRADSRLGEGDYDGSLTILAELKAPVDRFFDDVLVMDKDEAIRRNRLALLGTINATFTRIADFRQLAV